MKENMEEADTLTVLVPSCPEDLPIILNETQLMEEARPRVCPLCACQVKFFYINFQEQILICENVECEFPFGYEDLQFNRFEDVDSSDMMSNATKPSLMSPTGSMISTHAWSEIDKMNRAYESEDSQSERPVYDTSQRKEPKKLNKASITQIKKNVESIKDLNIELKQLSEPNRLIKNERWIKKLLNLQSMTKESLLKPQEIKKLEAEKKLQPEITINIQPGDDQTMSAIQIQIA